MPCGNMPTFLEDGRSVTIPGTYAVPKKFITGKGSQAGIPSSAVKNYIATTVACPVFHFMNKLQFRIDCIDSQQCGIALTPFCDTYSILVTYPKYTQFWGKTVFHYYQHAEFDMHPPMQANKAGARNIVRTPSALRIDQFARLNADSCRSGQATILRSMVTTI